MLFVASGISDVLLGELGHKSLDQVGLGKVSEVGYLGLTHRLGLLHDNLSDGLVAVHLGDGQGSGDLEVLRVEVLLLLEVGLGLNHRLNELVVNLLLDNWSNNNLGGLVATEEELALGGIKDLLGLGGLDESLKVVDLGLLRCGLSLDGLGLLSDLLDNILALLADGDSGVGVLHKSDELISLDEVSVVGLKSDVESDGHGESEHEANKSGSAVKVLVELLLGDLLGAEFGEERGHAGHAGHS